MGCSTRANVRHTLAWAALVALVALPADAQTYRTTFGVVGGWSTAGDLTPGLGLETILEDGWIVGVEIDTWAGRFGGRLTATYTNRALEGTSRSFQVAAAELGVMVRLLSPRRDRLVAPWVGVGIGPVLYMAEADDPPIGEGAYGSDPVLRWMAAPSVGIDLLTASTLGLRIEVVDQIVFPAIGESPDSEGTIQVHNLGARAALQLRVGRTARRPVIVHAPGLPEERGSQVTADAPGEATLPPPGAGQVYTVRVEPHVQESMAAAQARLEARGVPAWVTGSGEPGQRRLRVGAVDSMDDAELLARRMREEFGYTTAIEAVAPGETVPADAIVATLRFLFSP